MADSGQKTGGDQLLRGIAEQAKQEAERIISEADIQAGEIVKNARRKAGLILDEAGEKCEQQAGVIRRKNAQNIEAERRRMRLKAQEELFSLALKKVRDSLSTLKGKPEYPGILKGWIVEGAIGLGQDRLSVNSSTEERPLLTGSLLKEAEKEIGEKTGRRVKIELSKEAPLMSQGVFLSSANGRLAFNNLIEARLQRYSTAVRKMIYQQIQAESK